MNQNPNKTPGGNAGDGEDSTDPRVARREKMAQIEAMGIDPFGSRFDDRDLLGECRERAGEIKFQTAEGQLIELPDFSDESLEYRQWKSDNGPGEEIGPTVRVAGRVMLMRTKGKLIFLNIKDWTGTIQIFIGKQQVGDDDFALAKLFDLGDLISVEGRLGRTNTGELTIFAEKLFFQTKMLDPPPDKHAGLTNVDLKQRMRYADLAFNEGTMETFLSRTKIIKSVRSTLDSDGYCEVEGPTLHVVAGGAAARPFETHHNALDMPLTMRIALELHLKRLMVGGMERVYELGRVYRNEGLSPRHNPEFTMLEAYQAYGDYETMMDLTERIICNAIESIGGGYKRTFNDQEIDFTPPFKRATYAELFQAATNVDPADEDAVKKYAGSLGLDTAGKHPDVIRNEIFEEKVEDTLEGPIFVIDYPASICPLTKRKRDNPEIAERFELFICGMELANAYTELNDPDLQQKLFETQLEGLDDEESMAKMDHDFIRALRHAMPPAGGLGIGIDRLVMILTGQKSIRDVILFPVLRPTE
ncbi:lysine--tRNA ligase [Roseiconus lacunae]|uniref:Lysine--tRNA ligase n=1 Tax=Roseiconus lacunae TaxID=2605694 RepID=A0ABT7PE36_9BACT|nr:lysine--tRNA ligase [Roseiconus lacunae]MCD0459794.1 lysine--tRNA ligase [Roseiconus lacunae]MDM4014491.1 lysine--tRNA ligase [Roseiconus lacunae]WRQ49807.1 lysine--tRNA ligase [Stieleria sp. HD01]